MHSALHCKGVASDNIRAAYSWIVGGLKEAVQQGVMSESVFQEWCREDGVDEVWFAARTNTFAREDKQVHLIDETTAPREMAEVSKGWCIDYIVELFENDGYKVTHPGIAY